MKSRYYLNNTGSPYCTLCFEVTEDCIIEHTMNNEKTRARWVTPSLIKELVEEGNLIEVDADLRPIEQKEGAN